MKARGVLIVMLCMAMLAGCKSTALPTFQADQVQYLQVNVGFPMADSPKPLSPADEKEKPIVEKVVGWLASSTVSKDIPYSARHGYQDAILLTMSNGDSYEIEPAMQCEETQKGNATERTCRPVEGNLFLHSSTKKEIVTIDCPKLYTWLEGEWRQDIGKGQFQ